MLLKCQADVQYYNIRSRVCVVQESAWRCQVLTRVHRSRKCIAVSVALHSKLVLYDWYVNTMVKYIMHLEL